MASSDIKPYPFMFSPDQWSNTYSGYAGKALPFMGQYAGTPTDAHGNPIASYQAAQAAHDAWQPPAAPAPAQGTTLNTNPGGYVNPAMRAGANADALQAMSSLMPTGGGNFAAGPGTPQGFWQAGSAQDPAMQARMNPGPGAYYSQGASNSLGGNQYDSARIPMTPFAQAPVGPQGPRQAAPAAAAPTNPIDMNAAYLAALSNPGHVTTPGATVPQSSPPSNQSGVLQQFLANWQNKGSPTQGAGNYNNAGFFNALKGQV